MGSVSNKYFNEAELLSLKDHLSNSPNDWNGLGKMVKESFWEKIVSRILRIDHHHKLFKVIQKVNASFVRLEQEGMLIFDNQNQDPAHLKQAKEYRQRLKLHRDVVKVLLKQFDKLEKVTYGELAKEIHILSCHSIALRYRLGKAPGGIEPLPIGLVVSQNNKNRYEDALTTLKKLALVWKKKQVFLSNRTTLTTNELKQLQRAARYHRWVPLLAKDKHYQKLFFNEILRDGTLVEAFIKYPYTRSILKKALLPCYIGRIRHMGQYEVQRIMDVNTDNPLVKKRILAIPVYYGSYERFEADKQQWINVSDPSQIVDFHNGNDRVPVSEVINELAKANFRQVRFNLSKWGLTNFHPVEGGYWDANLKAYVRAPMTRDNWTQYVPPGDIVDQADLERVYGDRVKGRTFFLKMMATRKNPDLNASDAHGMMRLYIYLGNDKWKVLDVGVFAYRFRKEGSIQGAIDGLYLFCHTIKRVLAFVDQNGGYTHRQRAAFPLFPTEQEGRSILQLIYDISQQPGVFQFSGENCSYPLQDIIEKSMSGTPNFYRLRVTRGRAGFLPLDFSLYILDKCPAFIRRIGVKMIHTLFGSFRKLQIIKDGQPVDYSVANYYRNTEEMSHPSYLHLQIEEARRSGQGPFVNGELTWGNLEV